MLGKKHILFCLAVSFCFIPVLKSQFYNLPEEFTFSLLTEKQLARRDSSIHTAVKPYIHFFSQKYVHVEDSHRVFKFIDNDPALDVIFFKHFIRVEPKKEKFRLRIDPLINFETGRDLADTISRWLYTNGRGVIASAYIGEKCYVESMFSESQSVFPDYIARNAAATGVVTGQGRWKQFKTNGFDYAFSSGFVSIQPLKNLNIQFGHGKQKIGNGYRSLLLSDNAFNYPYARFTQKWFKSRVQYTNIYAVLMNLTQASKVINPNAERLFQKKAASFQQLSINLSKSINVGLFQGLIWQAGDDKNRQHLDWQFFNPLIYANLLTYGLNHRNNILTGADLRVKLGNKLSIYGQLMVDKPLSGDTTGDGLGYQAGLNYYDALGVKNLLLQAEFNQVSQSSYQKPTGSLTDQSYTHYNQNLAYTPGSGREFIAIADYKRKRAYVHLQYHNQVISSSGGAYTYNSLINARIGYVINPAYNLNICFGMLYRTQNFSTFNTLNNETNYIYFGIRTSIYNLYYDF